MGDDGQVGWASLKVTIAIEEAVHGVEGTVAATTLFKHPTYCACYGSS